jgi:putative ABC transport system substrate-binding protein
VWFSIKRLLLGLTLIAAASALLLATDAKRSGTDNVPRVAFLQQAATPVFEESERGLLEALEAAGYRDPDTIRLSIYNAHAEMATLQAIAREITNGQFDLVLTHGTGSLQAVANANKSGKTRHVFGLVADPYIAGVGLDPSDPMAHPRYMVGYGMMFPVRQTFQTARRMFPGLKTVGVAWNPAEINSLRFVTDGRAIAKELGITLLEAQVENTAGVKEAVQSLLGRGAQVIWVGGDSTISSAIDSVLTTARQARVPVFSSLPGDPRRGTLFDLGFDFVEAGRLTGEVAAKVLQGTDPATLPILDAARQIPQRLSINRKSLKDLRDPWQTPDDLLRQANMVVDDSGVHSKDDKERPTQEKP